MAKKSVLIIALLLFSNTLVAQIQESKIEILEKSGDSIYYNRTQYYNENDFLRLQQLRATIIYNFKDTINEHYKMSLSKKHAADALLFSKQFKFDSAIVQTKKAIEVYHKIRGKDLFYLAHLHKDLYLHYWYNKDHAKTLLHAKKSRDVFLDTLVYNHKLIAQAEYNIGLALGYFEEYDKIIEHYKKAIALNISNKGENNEDVAIQEHHLALTYDFIGFYKKELDSYLKVVKRWEAIEADDVDMSYLSIAYGSLCTWYVQHGDLEIAEQYLIKKENLIKRYKKNIGNWFNETFKGRTKVTIWYNYANLYLHKKDTLNALVYNKKILDFISNFDFNDESNNPHNLSYYKNFVVLNKLKALEFKANILKEEQPDKALVLYEEALQLSDIHGVSVVDLKIKLNLIDLYNKQKKYAKTSLKIEEWLSHAVDRNAYFTSTQLKAEKANLALVQNKIALMDKEYKVVFKMIAKDSVKTSSLEKLKYSDCTPYGNQSFIDLVLKASINYTKAYSKTKKKKYLQIGHNLNLLASDIFAVNFAVLDYNDTTYKTATRINDQLLKTSLLLNNEATFNDVLEKIEKSNSRLSWRKFLSSNQRKHLNIPDSILSKEEDLKTKLHFYKKELFTYTESDKEKPKVWKEIIFDLQKEIDLLNAWYKTNYKSYFNQTQKSFKLRSIKSKLKKRQKIIKYVFTEKKVYAFVISKDVTQLYLIADSSILSNKLKTLIKSLSERATYDFKLYAQSVYKLLLPPQILDAKSNEQLIFVLDGILHYVPMEILIDDVGTYLIEKHAVSYTPSLLLWNEQIGVKKSKNNKLGIFAPTYKKKKVSDQNRNENYDLKGAKKEASKIANLFNNDFFTGNKVTKKEFIKNANAYNVLHLAMHATINNIDSEFSYLNFPSNQEDNKLFISELYTMTLNADLAVLSACDTSVGNLEKGKGVINVSRAFTYAGVPSTVTSLWKVPDQETSQIMISFYKHLKDGKQKNEALQLAKMDYLSSTDDSTLKHPYYWAGFILSGDITAIKSPPPYIAYVILLSLLLLLALYFFRRKS